MSISRRGVDSRSRPPAFALEVDDAFDSYVDFLADVDLLDDAAPADVLRWKEAARRGRAEALEDTGTHRHTHMCSRTF